MVGHMRLCSIMADRVSSLKDDHSARPNWLLKGELNKSVSRDSGVGIATDYGLDD
jgi:hypothetical protein